MMKKSGMAIDAESTPSAAIDSEPEQSSQFNDNDSRQSSGRTKNRCTCGSLIVHVKSDEDGRQLSPRHQAVFNRLYRHRVTRELHRRRLAAEQIEKEARECTYIPMTNSSRSEAKSTSSSMSTIARRERIVDKAREQFHEGKMCVECLKKVEVSTGATVLDDELLFDDLVNARSFPERGNKNTDAAADEKGFSETRKKIVGSHYDLSGRENVSKDDCRNDEAVTARVKSQPSVPHRLSYGSFADHPPKEIVLTPRRDEKRDNANKLGHQSTATSDGKQHVESRNDDLVADSDKAPPSRVPPNNGAFSFDNVSPIPSVESPEAPNGPVPESLVATPTVKNTLSEKRETTHSSTIASDLSSTQKSSESSATTLKLDSYMSVDYPPTTPMSVPFDEKSQDDAGNDSSLRCNPLESERTDNDTHSGECSDAQAQQSPVSSRQSESQMRLTSILDREASFTSSRHLVDTVTSKSEDMEQKAADRAYIGCEMDEMAEMECAINLNESGKKMPENGTKNSTNMVPDYLLVAAKHQDDGIGDDREGDNDWIEHVTDYVACEETKPKTEILKESTRPAENEKESSIRDVEEDWEKAALSMPAVPETAPNDNTNGNNSEGKNTEKGIELCPSDEAFFGSTSQNSAERSSKCSTVALTEETPSDELKDAEGSGLELFLDKLTDCVTCWKLEP